MSYNRDEPNYNQHGLINQANQGGGATNHVNLIVLNIGSDVDIATILKQLMDSGINPHMVRVNNAPVKMDKEETTPLTGFYDPLTRRFP